MISIKKTTHLLLAITVAVLGVSIIITGSKSNQSSSDNPGKEVQVIKRSQRGLASFYSSSFDGKQTASGKIFINNELVAAHPTFPLGTLVRLTNLEDSSVVNVKIIDCGPTKVNQQEGVIIDISRAAAKKLSMIEDGRIKVRVEVLKWGKDK